MSDFKSGVVLLSDIDEVHSYVTLIEKSATHLLENSTLDVIILPKIIKLNVLDRVLAETYTLASSVLDRLHKTDIDVRVLYNNHYVDIKSPTWDLLVLDTSDDNFDKFKFDAKESLHIFNVQRTVFEDIRVSLDNDESQESIHKVGAVGGTFDHFHNGHKILLTASAFLSSEKLIVGVTDQELLENKKYKEYLQSYDYRVQTLVEFLHHIKPTLNVEPIVIRDVCGPTGYIEDIDALIVSRETVSGGDFVNKTRRERGLRELSVHVINVIGGEESDGFKNKLSSTQLREEQFKSISKN